MRAALSLLLTCALFSTVALSAGHDHDDGEHGHSGECLLCLVANGHVALPDEPAVPQVFDIVTPILSGMPQSSPRAVFIPIPDCRGPPRYFA